jgi:hypothetical protein
VAFGIEVIFKESPVGSTTDSLTRYFSSREESAPFIHQDLVDETGDRSGGKKTPWLWDLPICQYPQ